VDFNDDVDNCGFNTGGDEGFADFRDDRLVVFNEPPPLIDCLRRGLNEFDDGDLVGLLFVPDVMATSSERIELADSELVDFFSLKPVANDAQPLVFLTVDWPLVSEEFEVEIEAIELVELSDVVDSDD